MTAPKKIILYQAYGSKEIYKQVYFSLLTLYYHAREDFNQILIVVYTDNPTFFEKFLNSMPLAIEILSPVIIREFKGKNDFVHRVKIYIIKDCFEKFRLDIFYLDSDTYFKESPIRLLQQITPELSIMNSDDYNLISADPLYENMDWLAIRRVISENKYLINHEWVKIPLTTRMWNAGVIGLAYKNSHLLDLILDLTDQIYSKSKVFTAEQFAFSFFLQQNTNLINSGDVVFHYWPNFEKMLWKQTYDYHIKKMYKKNLGNTIDTMSKEAYKLSLMHTQMRLPEKNIFQKISHRLKLSFKVLLKGKI